MSMCFNFCLQGCHLMVNAGCRFEQRTLAILWQSHVWANPFLFSADLKSRFKGSRACFNTGAFILCWKKGEISGKVCFSFLPLVSLQLLCPIFTVLLFCPPFFIKEGGMIHAVKREQINNEPSSYLSTDYRKHVSTLPTHDAPVTGWMLFIKKQDRR